jgi:hypothetical protein
MQDDITLRLPTRQVNDISFPSNRRIEIKTRAFQVVACGSERELTAEEIKEMSEEEFENLFNC